MSANPPVAGSAPELKRPFTMWSAVEGFTDRQSYRSGETVEVRCSGRPSSMTAVVSRVGRERAEVWRQSGIGVSEQPVADDAYATGCDWPVTFTLEVDASWPSGFYEVSLQADGVGGDQARSEAFFVVRSSGRSAADALLVLATNTYNAYNQWGGKCLYSGATSVSFARPIERGYLRRPASPDDAAYDGRVASITEEPDEEHHQFQDYLRNGPYPLWCASSGWHNWERRFVRWAESEGISLDYAVNADLQLHPEVLDGHRLMASVGHDEYWSWAMRDRADTFVEDGGGWAIFSGNTCFWQVRIEDDGRTMVCFKSRFAEDPVLGTDRAQLLSTMWSLPAIGRPEAETTGLSFSRGGYARVGKATPRSSGGYTVHRPDHPVFAGTDLRYGDVLGAADRIVGYEVDGCELTVVNGDPVPTYNDSTPAGFEVLGTAPARLLSVTTTTSEIPPALWANTDPPGDLEGVAAALFGSASPENVARIAHNHAVMGTFEKGRGRVVHTGTTDWAFGLDRDPLVQQVTGNILRWLAGR
ncbi:MAG TPA: N,N-dimethylformamidase beta subunit family domain-containing protein [Nocardioidaceae bacterium]